MEQTMTAQEAIDFLKKYIANSRKHRQSVEWVDFNDYCEKYCVAIEVLINEIEKGKKVEE